MISLDDVIEKLPESSRETLRFLWQSLPASERSGLQSLLGIFPSETNLIRMLLDLASVQFKLAFGKKHRVVIVGPANVGKSTLYNQLIQRKEDQAAVSPLPGTTRSNREADAGVFEVIDTPGADAVGDVGEKERQEAFRAARDADFLVIMFDAIQGIKKTEQELFDELVSLGKPYIIVLNKTDLVRKESDLIVQHVASHLRVRVDQIVPISAKDGKNIGQILMTIAITEPEVVAALGKALPQYRWQLAWRTIASAASVSAVIALAPLPVIDFAPLIVAQSVMVLGIARIYDYKITLKRARELVMTFGLGFLGRTLFQELSKLGGLPGWLLSAAIAASTTVVMGYAAVNWFEKGEKLSGKALRELTNDLTQRMLARLKSFGKRKPSREALRQELEEVLKSDPAASDRSLLDRQAGNGPVQPRPAE